MTVLLINLMTHLCIKLFVNNIKLENLVIRIIMKIFFIVSMRTGDRTAHQVMNGKE